MNDLDKQRSKNEINSELNNSNWELRSFDSSDDIEVMIYLYDHFDTGALVMAGIRDCDIRTLSAFKHTMEDITNSIESAFQSYIREPGDTQKTEWTEVLGGMLGLYMLQTKTYSKLKSTPKGDKETKQFIVLRYKNQHSQVVSLRPFSLVSATKVLSPEDLKKLALTIIERDEKQNSGFFNFNPVHPLRK